MPSCLQRGTGRDRDPSRWGRRETIPNTALSPPEPIYTHGLIFRTHKWFCWSVLAECNSGIMLTWTSEEGHPLLKEDVVEYGPLFFVCFVFEEATVCKNRKAFCIRVFSVKKINNP